MRVLNKSKTFYLWFFSYIIVFIIPLVFSFFNYLYSVDIIRNESQYLKKTALNQMKDLVDLKLSEVGKMAEQIIWDREIRLYLKLNEGDTGARNNIEQKIKELRFLNTYIDQIYVINERRDFLSAERVIPFNHQVSGIDWKQISRNKEKSFLFDDVDKNIPGNELYFIVPFFMIGEGNSDFYVVIFINPALISDSMEQIEWLENGAGYVLENEGSVIYSIENIEIAESFKEEAYAFLEKKGGGGYIEFEKEKHIISFVKSGIMEWYYTIILPESVLYGKLLRFKLIVFFSLSICLTAGIFLSFIFTRKNYSPVLELINLFSESSFKKIYENYLNEFEILESEIKLVISENVSIKDTLQRNRDGLRRIFFRRLIMGEKIEDEVVTDLGTSFGVDFSYDNYTVMIINPSDENSLDFFTLKKNLDELSEQLENDFNSYLLVYSARNVIIVNIEDAEDYNALNKKLESVSAFLRENIKHDFIVTAGNIYDSIAGISLSYTEALHVLEYRTLLGEGNVLLFGELKKQKKERKFHYLSYLEDEYKVYNLLTAGKYEEAENLLNSSIDSIEEHYLDVNIIRLRLAGFKNILIEALNIILRKDPVNLKALVKLVLESNNFPQFTTASEHIFKKLSELSPDKSRSSIVSETKKYIENNYSDKNISVTDLSEKMGITSQHLSKIFKEISGIGVLQYINSCRIEEAKKILVNEQDISIKDTAGIIGYYNEVTFIRNFKNMTGISPGRFREASLKGDINRSD
ncbi:MAG: helix-turn-helix domain-containing protein [Spirochaetia bacterium]|nr:helix-turn-helix domain-containing protein [Spirochaetia bacterium]